ncbi:hypothetical protein [Desulforamulus ferrireducens]|uniref:hypothetical protein n=1 Tax=Desulforamulus ferrireducens TaxID=1833852 RepID=UPI0014733529|nr:hypothetical protein [Desulforamulus ferrireducens]
MRDSTWRYPNVGFWVVHAASLAAMGYLAFKAMDQRCGDREENQTIADQMPQMKEP